MACRPVSRHATVSACEKTFGKVASGDAAVKCVGQCDLTQCRQYHMCGGGSVPLEAMGRSTDGLNMSKIDLEWSDWKVVIPDWKVAS